jgi:hypothetical protein
VNAPLAAQPLRCIVNLHGEAAHPSHPPAKWAEPGGRVIDCNIHRTDPDPVGTYYRVRDLVRASQMQMGCYISYARLEGESKYFPQPAIATDQIPAEWRTTLDDRTYADIRNDDAARLFARKIGEALDGRNCATLLGDNVVHPSSWSKWPFPWDATIRFLGYLHSECKSRGVKSIPNIAGVPGAWPAFHAEKLAEVCDGVALEMPLHPDWRTPERIQAHINVYRSWLRAGKIVVFIPVRGSRLTPGEFAAEVPFIAAFAMLVREPGQELLVAWPAHEDRPLWQDWPERYGPPTGDAYRDGETWVRPFTRGVLTLNPPRDFTWKATPSTPPAGDSSQP